MDEKRAISALHHLIGAHAQSKENLEKAINHHGCSEARLLKHVKITAEHRHQEEIGKVVMGEDGYRIIHATPMIDGDNRPGYCLYGQTREDLSVSFGAYLYRDPQDRWLASRTIEEAIELKRYWPAEGL